MSAENPKTPEILSDIVHIMSAQLTLRPDGLAEVLSPFDTKRAELWGQFSEDRRVPIFTSYGGKDIDPKKRIMTSYVCEENGVTRQDVMDQMKKIEGALSLWYQDGQPEVPSEEFRAKYFSSETPDTTQE